MQKQTSLQLVPSCQSCGAPLSRPAEFGTEANGIRSTLYCSSCFKEGSFTLQDITVSEMREICVDRMVARKIMPRAQANTMMRRLLPTLKRWAFQPGARA